MANYDIIVSRTGHLAGSLKIIRKHSTRSISEIKLAIENGKPVLTIDSSDGPISFSHRNQVVHQHQVVLKVIEELRQNGDDVEVWYWVRERHNGRTADDQVLSNLMKSQLKSIDQYHD